MSTRTMKWFVMLRSPTTPTLSRKGVAAAVEEALADEDGTAAVPDGPAGDTNTDEPEMVVNNPVVRT